MDRMEENHKKEILEIKKQNEDLKGQLDILTQKLDSNQATPTMSQPSIEEPQFFFNEPEPQSTLMTADSSFLSNYLGLLNDATPTTATTATPTASNTIDTEETKYGTFHKNLAKSIVEDIKETFSTEVLRTHTLTGKGGYAQLDKDKMDLLKQRILVQFGASRLDWNLVLPKVKSMLRDFR